MSHTAGQQLKMFIPRPKPNETEEDILKQQEEFFKNKDKIKPAAKLVAENKSNINPESTQPNIDIKVQLANTFEAIPQNARLPSVVEKTVPRNTPSVMLSKHLLGFPQAKLRDPTVQVKKGSIFANQMKKRMINIQPSNAQQSVAIGNLVIREKFESMEVVEGEKDKNIPTQSYVITGPDKDELHNENVHKLHGLSERQIIEERDMLLETMDPAIVAFLRAKRGTIPPIEKTPGMVEQEKIGQEIKIDDLEAPKEILTHPDSEKWLNFDVVENSKLAWMKSPETPKLTKEEQYEARFDFDGNILPFVENEISEKSRILYHHGEDAARPGYTLQEIFQLCRSSVNQQKIVALNTLSNILIKFNMGLYENVLDLPIEQIFFVLRFCVDDNTPNVLNSAVKALRNLFYNTFDETCLDGLLGFGIGMVQPLLAVSNDVTEDDPTENDQQLAEKDLVLCLIRSDILIRIRYILNSVEPPLETVVYCLEILTRIARDSDFIVMRMYSCEGLISHIIQKYIFNNNNTSNNKEPIPEAYKLLRVLCVKNICYAKDLYLKHNIMEGIANCLSIQASNTNIIKTQIQALHLWAVLMKYDICAEGFDALSSVLFQILDHHIKNTDFDASFIVQTHVSALLTVISFYKGQILLPDMLIDPGFYKWTSQFCNIKDFSHFECGKLQLISSIFNCCEKLFLNKTISAISASKVELFIQNIMESKAFDEITDHLNKSSNLLREVKYRDSSANLKHIQATLWDSMDQVVPVLHTKSCIPFLSAFTQFIVGCNSDIKIAFLEHKNIKKYVNLLRNARQFYLIQHWFSRLEINLILNILKMVMSISERNTSIYYELAVKCLSVFGEEHKKDLENILNKILFNPKWFPAEVLMQNMKVTSDIHKTSNIDTTSNIHPISNIETMSHDITSRIDILQSTMNSLTQVAEVYGQVLGLKADPFETHSNLCLAFPIKNLVPVDWIYSPIVLLYSIHQQNKVKYPEDQLIFIIKNCLRWIYFYECHFTDLAALINPTERFCRLACVFLAKDDLFLEAEIQNLLELCFNCIIKNDIDNIDFDKPIQGLNNFQDFYIQLLDQYQGVSYGNVLFGNFIVVPCLQKHNVKWRKILWSEYVGAVQICNVTKNNLLLDLEGFLNPVETDVSLLRCYRKAIVNGIVRKGSALYDIANYHVERFVEALRKNDLK